MVHLKFSCVIVRNLVKTPVNIQESSRITKLERFFRDKYPMRVLLTLPLAASDGEMPVLSWRGKALSLGMSSCTKARGCPNTTDAARHTCLIRGPPALRNSWHSGEMSWGCRQQDFNRLISQLISTCATGLFDLHVPGAAPFWLEDQRRAEISVSSSASSSHLGAWRQASLTAAKMGTKEGLTDSENPTNSCQYSSIYTRSLTPDDLSCFCWSILISWTLAFLRRFNILLLAPVSRALWEATLSAEWR